MSLFFFKQKTAYEMRISDWSSDVCSSDLLPEAATHAIPVGNDGGGPFAVGLARMLLHQCLADILPMGGGKALPDDAVRIGSTLEIAVRIIDEGHAAGHARAELVAHPAEDHRRSAGHIFSAVRAAALVHARGPWIAAGDTPPPTAP